MKQDTILNIDCIEGMRRMPDGCVDLVLTDPPYGISRQSNFAASSPTGQDTDRFRISIDFGTWDHEGAFDISAAIKECKRVMKEGATIILFYDLWKIGELKVVLEANCFKQIRLIEWLKTNPVPRNSKVNYLTNAREVAVVAVKGSKPTFHGSYDKGVYEYPVCHEKNRIHPTQKPVDLIADLIRKHSNEGDTVLDFCMGSGTTAVACIKENRHYIGFEIDKGYFDKSIQRISECPLAVSGNRHLTIAKRHSNRSFRHPATIRRSGIVEGPKLSTLSSAGAARERAPDLFLGP